MIEEEKSNFETIRLMRDVHGEEAARHWGYEQRIPITLIDAALKAPREMSGDERFPGVAVGDRMLTIMSEQGITKDELANRIAMDTSIPVQAAVRMVEGLKGNDDPSLIVIQAYFLASMERQCETPEEVERMRADLQPELVRMAHGLRNHRNQENR